MAGIRLGDKRLLDVWRYGPVNRNTVPYLFSVRNMFFLPRGVQAPFRSTNLVSGPLRNWGLALLAWIGTWPNLQSWPSRPPRAREEYLEGSRPSCVTREPGTLKFEIHVAQQADTVMLYEVWQTHR